MDTDRRATYRLQLHQGFDFENAAGEADYLADLGISHLYLSPVLQATKGSMHGYDVVDQSRLSDDLGGERGWRVLLDASRRVGLGRLVDVVPNHMAITGPENLWWWDVLENGASSVYAAYFDVEWHPESAVHDQVLLPILGDHFGRELDAGLIELRWSGRAFVFAYFDHLVPVNPRSLDTVLGGAARLLPRGGSLSARARLQYLATALGRLPSASSTDRASVAERHRDKEILAAALGDLAARYPEVAGAVHAEVATLNASPDALDALLARQNYRLAWWRTASEELDYRRFFDINDLAAIRVEDPRVFGESHQLPLRWLEAGDIDGLRIDHVDGLWDPAEYLDRLADAAPGAWVVVEKILEDDEQIPVKWQTSGTTGYQWLAMVDGVCLEAAGAAAMESAYRRHTGEVGDYDEQVTAAKLEVLAGSMATDLNRLVRRLATVSRLHRRYRDYTRRDLTDVLSEIVAAFPVYRTYVVEGAPAQGADLAVLDAARDRVVARRPDLDADLVEFVIAVLAGRLEGTEERAFAGRVQQLTGPVMAKAVEDTVFYRHVALVSRNEVGGDPGSPPVDPAEFHRRAAALQRDFPYGLLATSTHDTKRAEDVRARVAVLAEMPGEWAALVERWSGIDRPGRPVAGVPGIDQVTEWMMYQTVFGTWPISAERLVAYLEKATREAKVHTSWTDPDLVYEEAVREFATASLRDEGFAAELDGLVDRLRRFGWSNGLATKLLTLTGPGVPDLYQGSELWDLSLVDPDNRRSVDYALRRSLLARVSSADPADLWAAEDGEGATKLAVVRAALAVRGERPAAFGPGAAGRYQPLAATGESAAHALAFVRGGQVVVVVTRLPLGLSRRGWRDSTLWLPPGRWAGRLDSQTWEGEVALPSLLGSLPVALLVSV